MKTRRLALAAAVVALAVFSGSVPAAGFPAPGKTLRILVGVVPGGPADIQARTIGEQIQKELDIPVVVENRPGAGMGLAAAQLARAPADGYTLLYSPSTPFAQSPHTTLRMQFDPLADFTPISLVGRTPLVLVSHVSIPATNLRELVEYARAHPDELNYSSFGTGSSSHLFGLMLAKQYGLTMTHVPYKGTGDVQKDIVAGRIQLMFSVAGGASQFVRTGQVRMIGVVAPVRSALLPNVPTLAEQGGKGFDIDGWLGLLGPAGMPDATTAALNAAVVRALAAPRVRQVFEQTATEVATSTPAEFASVLKGSHAQWGEVVRLLQIPKE